MSMEKEKKKRGMLYCVSDGKKFFFLGEEEAKGLSLVKTSQFVQVKEKIYRVFEGRDFYTYVKIDELLSKKSRFLCDYLVNEDKVLKKNLESKIGDLSKIDVAISIA